MNSHVENEAPRQHNFHPMYRPDIDGLRAIAILSVLTFHAFPGALRGGFVGVDIFFVISGFLISSIIFRSLHRGDFSFAEFYAHRLKRIFPALILVLAASFAFGWFALLSDEYGQLGKHMAAGAGFVQNFVLWKEAGYFDTASELKPLMHLWSLAIEEQFYLIYPVLIWGSWRLGLNVLTVVLVIGLLSFAANITGIGKDAVGTFFMPQTRFWELLSGSVLAYMHLFHRLSLATWLSRWMFHPVIFRHPPAPDHRESFLNNLFALSGLLLIVAAVFGIHKGMAFPGWLALVPVAGAFLLIMAGPQAWVNRNILAHKMMVFVGLISYPLYLWHWSILSFARIVESEFPSPEIRFAAVAISFLLAWLTYRLIEKPIRFGRKAWIKTAGTIFLMVVVGYIGYNTYQRDGLAFRSTVKPFKNNKNELVRLPAVDEPCKVYVNSSNPIFPYCRFSDVGTKNTVAVIGDSHAHVAYAGIAERLSSYGLNAVLLANSGCPVLLGAEYGKSLEEKNICKQEIEKIIQIVIEKKDIKKVFIFTRGPLYMTGKELLQIAGPSFESIPISKEIFIASLQRTVDALNNAGKSVFYVTENPELEKSPEACIKRPLRVSVKNCEMNLPEVKARQNDYLTGLASIKGATIINTLQAFCTETRCKVFDEKGALLYADRDHLSYSGSWFQVNNVLDSYFKEIR